MILAAGLGRRMLPLTETCPKPLLRVGGKPLLQYHLDALASAGVNQVIINLAYLGKQIAEFVGNGSRFGIEVQYSREPEPLETGGALLQALPLLGEAPLLLLNGDVWCDLPLSNFIQPTLAPDCDGRLLLVPNPEFHPEGDFALSTDGFLSLEPELPRATFAGISLLRPSLISEFPNRRPKFPLLEALKPALVAGRLEGRLHTGEWSDVGTPERLRALNLWLEQQQAY